MQREREGENEGHEFMARKRKKKTRLMEEEDDGQTGRSGAK